MRTLTITAAEVPAVQAALATGEPLWLVREARTPCETCHGAVYMLGSPCPDGTDDGLPCPDCRIELVGPCPTCDGDPYPCWTCKGTYTVTLGHAYAVGSPLPIVGDTLGIGDYLIVDPDGDVWALIDEVDDYDATDLTDRLAHCGPPETLVGKWALQLAVVGS